VQLGSALERRSARRVRADGQLDHLTRAGQVFVFAAKPKFEAGNYSLANLLLAGMSNAPLGQVLMRLL
jgi:hypothetical protein